MPAGARAASRAEFAIAGAPHLGGQGGLAYGPSPLSSSMIGPTVSAGLFWLSLRLATTVSA